MKNLTLNEFVDTLRDDIKDFNQWWRDQAKENPEAFASFVALPISDWWEQFIIFCEGREGRE